MNKLNKLLALTLFSVPGTLFAQNQEFTIKGKVEPGSKIVQVYFSSGPKLDSAKVVNGTFEFRSSVKEPISTALIRDKQGKGFKAAVGSDPVVVFYEEPGEILIDLPETGEFANVTGGKANKDLQTYNKLVADIYQQNLTVLTQLQSAKDEDEARALSKKRRDLFTHNNLLTLIFAIEHPNSYVALDKAYLVARMENTIGMIKEAELAYNGFNDELKQSKSGIAFKNLLPSKLGTVQGAQALDFTVVDSLNHAISLSSLRGKYVLLDFWASWCGPCRQENPNVLKAYEQYKNKNFTVLAISLDKKVGRDKWLKAVKDDQLTYQQAWDPEGKVAKQYLISAIPHNLLIDPAGKIIAINLTGEVLMRNLAKVLNK